MWAPRIWVVLLLLGAVCANEEEETSAVEEEKEVFVPIKFETPQLSTKPHFFDCFPVGSKIGQVWHTSTAKKDGAEEAISKYNGEWSIGAPSEVSIDGDLGLIVKTKARHHAIAARLEKKFEWTEEKPLVVQYEVKFEEGQECGGGYLKLLAEGAEEDLAAFNDKTPYTIMFGPDKCGQTGKVHLIFKYKNPKNGSIDEYHAKQADNIGSSYWDDHKTHLYTLTVHSSGSYDVKVDQSSLYYGNMLQNLNPSLTPPTHIADPSDVKPEDWDERAEIDDETAVKPEDWDEAQPKEVVDTSAEKPSDWLEDENALVADPAAVRPSDWDDEMDGEWEAPMVDNPLCEGKSGCGPWKQPTIPNPLYKGKWRRPRIANPAYRGVWSARQIENPHFFDPAPFAGLAPVSAIGIELWTMSSNIIFDNILLTDSEQLASEVAAATYTVRRAEEARLASSKGENQGIFASIIAATEEKPWLWIVFILCILLPLIGIAVFCFGRKSDARPSTDAYRKKTDAIVPDDEEEDEAPQLVPADDDERVEEMEVESPPVRKSSRSRSPARKGKAPVVEKKKQTMADLEDSDDDNIAEETKEPAAKEAELVKATPPSPKKSPAAGATKRRVRRQD